MHDYIPLQIAAVRPETEHAVAVSFAVPEAHRDTFRWKPGQYLALRATINEIEERRTYSICSAPGDQRLTVAIKRIDGGVFSNWAADTLKPGMTLDSMPPAGRFVLPDAGGENGHILGIAAGAGITPILAIAEHALARSAEDRVTLLYGNRDIDSIMFRERLEDLKDRHLGRFTLIHLLSRNEESETPLLEGRITGDKITALASQVFRAVDLDHAFLCGPGSLIKEARTSLFALGMARDRVHHEFFAAGGGAFRAVPAAPAPPVSAMTPSSGEVDIIAMLDGARRKFTARRGETLIEAALRAGLKAPYSCKGGMCSTCRAKIVDGVAPMRVNYSLEPWEIEQGFVLTCQAVPGGERVVIDWDQM